jgi:hypothetical protein
MFPAIRFVCQLTSPFHTSDHNYSNLYTCAPYILGSTLRGAILRGLIDEYCEKLDQLHECNPEYHLTCDAKCPIQPLFELPTRFSFGQFLEDSKHNDSKQQTVFTRNGISRVTNRAASGALVSIEVLKGSKFHFDIMYGDNSLDQIICKGVKQAGKSKHIGIGRFRSIGWGQFKVCSCDFVKPQMPPTAKKYEFEFQTPYVLDQDTEGGLIKKGKLMKHLEDAIPGVKVPDMEDDDIQTQVTSFSYVRRWSDEDGRKENRLVLDKGTKMIVSFRQAVEPEHLYLWQWGIGEWRNYGFGSFVALPIV